MYGIRDEQGKVDPYKMAIGAVMVWYTWDENRVPIAKVQHTVIRMDHASWFVVGPRAVQVVMLKDLREIIARDNPREVKLSHPTDWRYV